MAATQRQDGSGDSGGGSAVPPEGYGTSGASGTPAAPSAVDFSTALSIWRDINLTELQSSLAQTAPPLLEAQRTALLNRKRLAEQTRDFKKQPDDAKLEAIKPLLKAYQAEIDTLTKRSKTAENAFLNVHSALTAAPDPYPLLEIVLEQAASLNDLDAAKAEATALRQENQQLKAESAKQAGESQEVEKLRSRVQQLESDFDSRLAQQSEAVANEVAAKWDERIRNLQEREQDLSKSLRLAQEQLQVLRSNDESVTARLLEQGQEADDRETHGKLAEMELLSRDIERAQSRVESVERRNEQLRAEIESVKSGRDESDKLATLSKELAQKDTRVSQLQQLVESEQEQLRAAKEEARKANDALVKLQKEREVETDSLKAKLSRCADYDDIKRELEIVKMVEFANEYGDDDDEYDDQGDEKAKREVNGAGAKPLEALLLEKNRRLQDQVTSLRVSLDELNSASTSSSSELSRLKKQVATLQSLNEKLENDLVSLGGGDATSGPNATPAARSVPASAAGTTSMSAEDMLAEMDRIALQPSASSASKAPATSAQQTGTSSAQPPSSPAPPRPSTSGGGNDTSILPIITSQRDRFRARNAELEEELRKQFSTISELRSEIKTLQADNLGLYEKLRYLQTYPSQSNGGTGAGGEQSVRIGMSGIAAGSAYPPAPGGGGRRGSADEKYRARYEESMSPWERFKGREQNRAISSMTPPERLLHMLTRAVLSHRRMRLLFIFYAVGLHALVFGMLFEVGHSSSTSTCAIDRGP